MPKICPHIAFVFAAGNWSGSLYREFQPADAVPLSTTFIPYYTWANRGRSEMTVWLPVDY